MNIFHHIHFEKIDPLGDGLREMIQAEQTEAEAINLYEDFDATLADNWQAVLDDARNDPEYNELMHSIDE